MKTKSRGAVTSKALPGYNRYYTLDKKGEWVFIGQESWCNTLLNGRIETITYDDTKRSGPLKRTRYCDHTTCEINGESFITEAYTNSSRTEKYVQKSGSFGDTNPPNLPASLSSVHSEALAFFESGCTNREFDLAVNLVEWKSTASLFQAVTPLLKNFKYFLNSANKVKFLDLAALELNKKVQEITFKDLANLHLSYEFGLKPLLQDLEGLHKALMSIEEKFTWLRKNQGKPVKVRFSKDLSTVNKPAGSVADEPSETLTVSVRHYECRYNAYALLVYDTSKLNDAELALRLFARMAGVDSALRNMWELVPYSFAIDWFLDVGTWIESFDPSVSLPYKVLDLGWSIRIVEVLERWKSYKYPISDHIKVYGGTRKTRFYREPGLPISFSSIATGLPGAKQLALSLSLAVQKFHR